MENGRVEDKMTLFWIKWQFSEPLIEIDYDDLL
jgi:hypothetical protein